MRKGTCASRSKCKASVLTVEKRLVLRVMITITAVLFLGAAAWAQGVGGAGTVKGTVKDPTGGMMAAVTVTISNAVTGFTKTVTTEKDGSFQFLNLAPNGYHVTAKCQGLQTLERDVDVRSSVPIALDLTLALGAQTTSVEVVGQGELTET